MDSGCPQGAGVPRAWTVAVHRGVGTQTRGQWLFTGGVGGQGRGQWLSTAGSGARWRVAVHKRVGRRGVDSGCQGVGGGAGRGQWLSTGVGGPGAWTAAVHREWGGGRGVDSASTGGRAWTAAVHRGGWARGVDRGCSHGPCSKRGCPQKVQGGCLQIKGLDWIRLCSHTSHNMQQYSMVVGLCCMIHCMHCMII